MNLVGFLWQSLKVCVSSASANEQHCVRLALPCLQLPLKKCSPALPVLQPHQLLCRVPRTCTSINHRAFAQIFLFMEYFPFCPLQVIPTKLQISVQISFIQEKPSQIQQAFCYTLSQHFFSCIQCICQGCDFTFVGMIFGLISVSAKGLCVP